MLPEIAKFLEDVRQACLLVEDFTKAKSFVDYQADVLLRSAVERQFITIGEALMQAEKVKADLKLLITAFRKIIGFRNLLVHGYAVVHHPTVWGVVENDLPILKQEVEKLLSTVGRP